MLYAICYMTYTICMIYDICMYTYIYIYAICNKFMYMSESLAGPAEGRRPGAARPRGRGPVFLRRSPSHSASPPTRN